MSKPHDERYLILQYFWRTRLRASSGQASRNGSARLPSRTEPERETDEMSADDLLYEFKRNQRKQWSLNQTIASYLGTVAKALEGASVALLEGHTSDAEKILHQTIANVRKLERNMRASK